MKKHKLLAVLLALAMTLSLLPTAALAEGVTADYSWYEAEQTEFTLSDAADLLGFANIVNGAQDLPDGVTQSDFADKTVKLGADIDLSGINWAPIGGVVSYPSKTFAGTFDGRNHTISKATPHK